MRFLRDFFFANLGWGFFLNEVRDVEFLFYSLYNI